MKQQINIDDRVKSKGDLVYLRIVEILPEDKFVVTLDLDSEVGNFEYIVDVNDIEFIRGCNDPLIKIPEIGVIAFILKEEFEEDFDSEIELCKLEAKTEYPEYNQKLLFNTNDSGIVVVYVKL